MPIQKYRTNSRMLNYIQENGRMICYKPIKPHKGKVYHLVIHGNDQTHIYAKLGERLPDEKNHYYLKLLCTASSLNIGEMFRFKGRKTVYVFAGWCGIENLPMYGEVGTINASYFNPLREIEKHF